MSLKHSPWLVTTLVCGILGLLTGCGGGGTTLVKLPATLNKIIGTTGGSIQTATSAGSTVTLSIPAGALSTATDITMTAVETANLPAPVAASTVLSSVTLGPSGTTFPTGTPAQVTFPLPAAKPAGSSLPLLLWDATNAAWSAAGTATVDGAGTTATASIAHFSTYTLVDTPGILRDTKTFLFGPAAVYTGTAVTTDMSYSGNGINASLAFTCPVMKVSTQYAAITQAPAGAYAPATFSSMNTNPAQKLNTGDVFVGYAKDYTLTNLPPVTEPATFYFKMRVIALQGQNVTGMMVFEFERISEPPLNITGTWKLQTVWQLVVTAGATAGSYTAVESDMEVMRNLTGTLSGRVFSGTWTMANGLTSYYGGTNGTFTMTFNTAGTGYTMVYHEAGHPDITYTGTR